MADVPVGTRLKKYGIDEAKANLGNLTVTGEYVLSASNQAVAKSLTQLHPATIDDVKTWIGSPNVPKVAQPHGVTAAAQALLPRSGVSDFHQLADIVKPLPAQLTAAHTAALFSAANQFVMTDVPVEKEVVANLNKWIATIKPIIIVFHFRDITVKAGSKLILATANSVLFANNITIEKTGKIVSKATVTKIDCAGIKGN